MEVSEKLSLNEATDIEGLTWDSTFTKHMASAGGGEEEGTCGASLEKQQSASGSVRNFKAKVSLVYSS